MTQHNNHLSLNQQGRDVALLQSRLITLGYTIATSEIIGERFGESTQQAVLHFQQEKGLPVTGLVDAITAEAIVSRFEADKAVIMTRPPPISPQTVLSAPTGSGDGPGKPIEIVRASFPPPVPGKSSGDNGGLPPPEYVQIGLLTPNTEQQGAPSGPGPRETVANVQKEQEFEPTGLVEGTVASPDRAGVGGLRVQIVDKNVGPDVPLVETMTDERGRYQVRFAAPSLQKQHKQQPDLQARVYAGQTFLAASDVHYNATTYETLHVRLPANSLALPSEHETLTGALAAHYDGQLGDLKESDDRQDITYLANKSGWDARAVALAALADQFSQHRTDKAGGTAETGIHPAFYYALFRAGLPANPDTLYQADASIVGQVWKQAIEQGVIPQALANEIPQAVQTFQSLSATHILNAPAVTGSSTLKEMLHLVLGDDAQRQQQFADLYTRCPGDLPRFWSAVQQSFGEETTKRLQLDGQLGYLTLNNAPLINRLHDTQQQKPLSSTLDLAQRGYYHAEKWGQILDGTIPEQIPGATLDEKRVNYAELLATQVRLSFPTAVVAEMVHSNEIPVTADARDGVYAFLTEHQGKFEIGMHPIEQYLVRNKLSDKIAASVKEQLKRIQRVYQITPTDQAMTVLLKNNLDSAYQVIRYDEAEFVQRFKDELGGENNARLTYAKSQQVRNAVLNIASSYLTTRTAFALGSHTDALIINPSSASPAMQANNTSDVVASQTLEGLFGSMDYCTCEHCRSILSPAAYLVDLLLFLDRPVNEKENPQAVLLERRPDIAHLPLTCENTNMSVPYIDLVNETLEYFITQNLSLSGYTGYDTDGSLTAEELLASPQFVKDAAYDILKAELFPPPLPFHRSLEMLRRYFDKFGVPLQAALETLRADDAIERASAATYGWRDILMEQLTLSRAEYALLTDCTLTLQQIYGYAPTTPPPDVPDGLSNAKAFARRVRVTYEDVIELLKTNFINPHSTLIPRLERLGVPFSTLKAFKDGTLADAAFDTLLPAGLDPTEYGGDIKAWVKDSTNYARIMGLIVLANPASSTNLCSFDQLEFRYTNPDPKATVLRAIEYVRLLRFIRLWRKLGLTIEQTDKLITALYPADDLPTGADDAVDLQHLDTGFLTLLPRLGIVFQIMNRLNLRPVRDLPGLLACWSPIDTHGANSLYQQMFLNPALLKQDATFAADSYDNFLQDPAQKLITHSGALRAAFNLTGDEFTLIITALSFDANTPLTLDNISAIYRRGWLARKLRLSVRELLLLIQFTGLDPFVAPDPANPPVIHLMQLIQALRAASLKPVQALYLLWNQDLSGKSAPDQGQITAFARTLRAAYATIESEFAVVDDPSGDVAHARMALVYGSDATSFFFGLLGNTLSVDVPYSHPQATLEQPILDAAAGRISYDDFRKRLVYAGVLSTTTRDALQTIAGVSATFQTAVGELYSANQAAIGPFFARYPELLPLYSAYAASLDSPEKKRAVLLNNFLPELKRRRKRQQALAVVSSAARVDNAFAQAILDDATVLHAAVVTTQSALDDLTALETPGLSAQFFWHDTATGSVDSTLDAVPALAYSATGASKLPANPTPGNAISAVWSGYLEAPENGFYNIAIETDAGAILTVTLGGESVALAQNGNTWSNQNPLALIAGTLYAVVLQVEKVTNTLAVRWETAGRGWEVIPARYLYSSILTDHLGSVYIRFLKTASLATGLKLTANESAHFAAHADYHIGGQSWLNALPVAESLAAPTAQALRDVLVALLDFARIKAALSPDDERLLSVLQDPSATLPNGDSLLLTLTSWESGSLNALLTRFSKSRTDLAHLDTFQRVYDASTCVTPFGIAASTLLEAMINEPDANTVHDLQAALRARYAEADWLNVLKPINDEMRGLQRDALVAYVLQKLGEVLLTSYIDTPDKLFEYFLMDVQMDPCMQTSRIRHALSSVQLFIERCLMNLEQRVASSSIIVKQWAAMKRYRIREANLQVWLWPENWLEPDLRDDQSPFFKEAMSELLQSDITEDTAATALLNYLSKLEEVAKLEPCGIHYVESSDPGKADDIAHVVARTAGAHRKYYYRRREHDSWTPWEQIKLEIEDNPVIPVIWNSRLLLFWLRILKQTPVDPNTVPAPSTDSTPLASLSVGKLQTNTRSNVTGQSITVQAVLCWSEYYNGKWQPTKTSDINQPTELGQFDPAGKNAFDRSRLQLRAGQILGLPADALLVDIGTGSPFYTFGKGGPGFILYNTHSLPIRVEDIAYPPFKLPPLLRLIPTEYPSHSSSAFNIYYMQFSGGSWLNQENAILETKIGERVVKPQPNVTNVWDAPFFYEDSRSVFYVTTDESTIFIWGYNDYGLFHSKVNSQRKQVTTIPPLVLQKQVLIPDKIGPVITTTNAGVGDPVDMQRFVSEDANIRTALGTSAAVQYGNREIGPLGSLSNGHVVQGQ